MAEKMTVGQLVSWLKKHDENLFVQLGYDTNELNIRPIDYKGGSERAIATAFLASEYEYRQRRTKAE